MTSNTAGAAQGEWHVEPSAYDHSERVRKEGEHGYTVWLGVGTKLARELNELERKAQMADVLAKALDNMLRWEADVDMEIPNDELLPFYLGHAKDWNLLLDAGRAALAQFHAVTEEATR